MTLTLELQSEEVALLEARARALGVDVASVLHGLIRQIAEPERALDEMTSLDEWEQALDKLSDDIDPAIPPLLDQALTRESLYADRVR